MPTMSARMPREKLPNIKYILLCNQDFQCIYCSTGINQDEAQLEHFYPYSYVKHKTRFYVSCRICNQIKKNKLFDNLEEACEYIKKVKSGEIRKEKLQELRNRVHSTPKVAKVSLHKMSNAKMGGASSKRASEIKVENKLFLIQNIKSNMNGQRLTLDYMIRLASLIFKLT